MNWIPDTRISPATLYRDSSCPRKRASSNHRSRFYLNGLCLLDRPLSRAMTTSGVSREMAGHLATVTGAAQRRHFAAAQIRAARAAAVEAAHVRVGIDRAHRLAGEAQLGDAVA